MLCCDAYRVEELHRKEAASQAAARAQAVQPLSAAAPDEAGTASSGSSSSSSMDGATRPTGTPAELIYSGDSSFLMQGLY